MAPALADGSDRLSGFAQGGPITYSCPSLDGQVYTLLGAQEPLLRLKAPLDDTWLPYLPGRGTRDEALAALLARISARP
jgi:hypothetical protein